MAKDIVIMVTNEGVFLNPGLFVPAGQTTLPFAHVKFSSRKEIYWTVAMTSYDRSTQTLSVDVVEYDADGKSRFHTQQAKAPVKSLVFSSLDWPKLEPLLISYQKKLLLPFLKTMGEGNADPSPGAPPVQEKTYRYLRVGRKSPTAEDTGPELVEEKEILWVPFHETRFALGYVAFDSYMTRAQKLVSFKILNENILPEFDNIKFWFSRKLKAKKFRADVTVVYRNNEVVDTRASSRHIDAIDSRLIDSIRYQRTMAVRKASDAFAVNRSLFTADELFNGLGTEDQEGNVFRQSEEDILKFFLDENKVRNRRQLAYLAGKKQSENAGIRFTLHPDFGFLFFIEGTSCNHFVWELLNSNATYVWSFQKGRENAELQLRKIEDTINTIRAMGRENYKRAYKNNNVDVDLLFRVITHEHIGSQLVDDFPSWKARLNEQLV